MRYDHRLPTFITHPSLAIHLWYINVVAALNSLCTHHCHGLQLPLQLHLQSPISQIGRRLDSTLLQKSTLRPIASNCNAYRWLWLFTLYLFADLIQPPLCCNPISSSLWAWWFCNPHVFSCDEKMLHARVWSRWLFSNGNRLSQLPLGFQSCGLSYYFLLFLCATSLSQAHRHVSNTQ